MDFDEYEYLERTVEGPDGTLKSNGGDAKRLDDTSGRISKGRKGEYGNGEFKSKRMRSEERDSDHDERDRHQSREKDRVREKSRDRDGDRKRSSRDRDRERDHERNRLYDRERSRERSRDRERERSRDRGRSRELDPHRDYERDKDRFYDRERSRERSRDRERERSRDRGRSRELDPHRDYERERESRERREKKEVSVPAEPEADPERDQRTVFAYQICLKADERDVYEFFSQAGKVRDVRLIMDRNSRRSKGVGYIEFYDALSVPMAIAMSGQTLLGQPVMVKPSEAEKNLVQSTIAAANGAGGYVGPYSGGARRLYVGNLHFNITEDQLRQVFEPFGPVELVQLPADPETGHCKGFGFVQYQRLEDARAAQQALNGILELAGRVIKVSAVSDQFGMQDMGVNPGDLDDDEGGGLALNAHSRALLMQKLDRSGIVTGAVGAVSNPVTAPLGILGTAVVPALTPMVSSLGAIPGMGLTPAVGGAIPGMGLTPAVGTPIAESIGTPSEFLLLKNMFDPLTETEPDFDLDIKEDVQEECSKFGFVKHIFIDKNSPGHVYLRFNSLTAASNAQRALHGRWFAGKMITATFMTALAYEYKFPESR